MRQLPLLFSLLALGALGAAVAAQQPAAPPPTQPPAGQPPTVKPPATQPPGGGQKADPAPGPRVPFTAPAPRAEPPAGTPPSSGKKIELAPRPPEVPFMPPASTQPPLAPLAPGHPPQAVLCPPHPWDGRTIVFAANGAGGGTTFSENLRDAAAETRSGLIVRTVPWARYGTVYKDNSDTEAHFKAAARLAEHVQELQSCCPNSRFVLVGYSAGSRVVLAAAEMLPPCSLDRVVLLASSVSCRYELRPALRASCGGIDNFYSADDQLLAMAEEDVGTTDGQRGPMAGRVGFRDPSGECDGCPYPNLRQHRWRADLGGMGTHAYWVRPLFLRNSLVPLLMTPGCPVISSTVIENKEPPVAAGR